MPPPQGPASARRFPSTSSSWQLHGAQAPIAHGNADKRTRIYKIMGNGGRGEGPCQAEGHCLAVRRRCSGTEGRMLQAARAPGPEHVLHETSPGSWSALPRGVESLGKPRLVRRVFTQKPAAAVKTDLSWAQPGEGSLPWAGCEGPRAACAACNRHLPACGGGGWHRQSPPFPCRWKPTLCHCLISVTSRDRPPHLRGFPLTFQLLRIPPAPAASPAPCRDPHSCLHHRTPLFHIQAPGPEEPRGSWRDGGGWVGSACILPA